MNIPQLLKDRGCGFVRVTFTTTERDDLQEAMSRLGLQIGPAGLHPIDAVEAEAALSRLFLRDLAYGAALMERTVAQMHARVIIAECASSESSFFTNAHWQGDKVSQWNPVSSATFNVVILIMNAGSATSVLVEDED
jgi:hypothetical protein